jgi:regulator of sirC expression with transglutaminase-like and TPR domain
MGMAGPSAADPALRLRDLVAAPGAEIDIAEAALACAELDRPDLDLAPYRAHLRAIAAEARSLGDDAPPDGLAALLAGTHGYRGDAHTYDDLANADLTRVIDRRCGLPVALAILWMHAARARGWRCVGLNMPAHFLLRLEAGATSWVLDPFAGGAALDRAGLAARVAALRDAAPGLRAEDLAELDDRAVLLRLQNNIRVRLQQAGETQRALDVLGRMLVVAPGALELWQEASALHEALGSLRAARDCLDSAMALAGTSPARQRIAAERARLASRLN